MPANVKPVERIRSRIQQVRARAPLGGQKVVGGGTLINRARQRAETVTLRIKERKPQLVPKIREWKPGTRIRQVLAPQYYGGVMDKPGMSVETEREQRLADQRGISVEW